MDRNEFEATAEAIVTRMVNRLSSIPVGTRTDFEFDISDVERESAHFWHSFSKYLEENNLYWQGLKSYRYENSTMWYYYGQIRRKRV